MQSFTTDGSGRSAGSEENGLFDFPIRETFDDCCASIDEQSAKSMALSPRPKILLLWEIPIKNPKSKIQNRFT